VILAGSWERRWMVPEGLSLFLSLSSWVRTGMECACGDRYGQDPGSHPTSLPTSRQAEQSRREVGPAGRVETPPRSEAASCSHLQPHSMLLGCGGRLGSRVFGASPLLPGCAWLFQGRAMAHSRWRPQSSLRALAVRVDVLVWVGCRVSAVSRVLAVVLVTERRMLGNEPVRTSPAAPSRMWCVSRCVWVSDQ